jgi:hypothetical protein
MGNQNYICHTDLANKEHNDCTVRSLAHTLTGDYELAHVTCSKYGRHSSRGMSTFELVTKMLPELGFEAMLDEELVNPGNTRKGRYTVASFIKDFVGKDAGYNYYLITNRHAVGVTSEGISDSTNYSGRARIKWAFKIKK